ncbi:hypothetical protein [Eubacterium oxidoreducens]|uniref:Uncharacterized protein n=1 Tax=Eubacterium oxidoreducens TaxID=1732 RepID=A0A1G6B3P5_EUBOX|nr:hypothetical protein [Eubacterium oxidoreducens]SDB15274.1 hypothetical protein SAMN02910417_01133 [Eubacterium oxidoreducens]
MKVTQTIELTDAERITVQKFLKLSDDISSMTRISMSDVFEYFVDNADIQDDDTYVISELHQINDM